MRQSQRQRYAEQIDRVVQHLQSLDWSDAAQATDLESLASIASLSSWHFHRVFRLMTGESLGELVRRLRIARGVTSLDGSTAQVTQAASASGYATPQAFARAVRQATGLSPTDVLRSPEVVATLRTRLKASASGERRAPLSIEITSIDPFTVSALRNVGDYKDLDAVYGRLFDTVFAEQPLDILQGIYGVPLDDPFSVQPQECRFECAVRISGPLAFPPPVRSLQLAGGKYVVGHHVGDYNLIHAAIEQLFESVLDCEDVRLADAPIHIRYHDQPEERPVDELRADIFIPIEWEA